jgi:competence protein ComEC
MYHRYLISITLGLFFGIIFAFKLNFSSQIFFVSFVICILNIFIYKFSRRSFGVFKSKAPLILSFFFFFISVGIVLGQISISKDIERQTFFTNFISREESFTGFVNNINKSLSSQSFILNLSGKENFKLKIITNISPEYFSGEKIIVKGKIDKEKIILPDGDKYKSSFSLTELDLLHKIDGSLSFPKIERLSESQVELSFSQRLFSNLENLKIKIVKLFKNNFSYYGASLAAGTTLGDDSIFTKSDIEAFRKVGLSHIIVLSGFNITILILAVSQLFLFLNIRLNLRIVFSCISILIFVIFVGASPSIVRASIMGTTLLISFTLGRVYFAKQALFFSAFLMMIFNPKIAVYDASFHLSFLATFAILYFAPLLEEKYFFKTDNLGTLSKNIKEIFRISFAVQIVMIPYLGFIFGKISFLSAFLNIMVLPLIPLIMLFSFLGILFFPLGKIFLFAFGILVQIFAYIIFTLTNYASSLTFSNFNFSVSSFSLILFYIILFFYIFFEIKRRKMNSYLNTKKDI